MGKGKLIQNSNISELIFRQKIQFQIILVFLLVFILYGNTIFNKYSLDDELVVIENPTVAKGIKGIPEILSSRYTKNDKNVTFGYRPIVKVTYAIEHSLWSKNPYLSHLTNILLYVGICILLLLILRRLFKDYNAYFSLLIILLFGAHPVHTEVVASLKNRDEILCIGFALLSTWSFLRYADSDRVKFILFGLLAYLLSYLSKPTSIPYIALIPLILYFFTNIKLHKLAIIALGLLAVAVVGSYGPELFLPPSRRPRRFFENNIRYEDFWTRFTTGMYILYFYFKKLIIPFPLLHYYGYNMIPILKLPDIRVILSLLFHGSIFIYAVVKIREKSLFSFIILFYLISIAMFTNIVRPVMGIVAERFLLTPSIAFSILMMAIIFRLFKSDFTHSQIPSKSLSKILVLTTIVLIPYTALTIKRNMDWKDQYTLSKNDMKYLENSVKANEIYADELKKRFLTKQYEPGDQNKLLNDIEIHYKKILRLVPNYHEIWNNLAVIYLWKNQINNSIQCSKKAIEIQPINASYHFNLAGSYDKVEQFDEAINSCTNCLELDSTFNRARFLLSKIYLLQNEIEFAKEINFESIKIDSLTDKPYINLGVIFLQLGDTTQAVQNWEAAVNRNPNNQDISRRLSQYFRISKDNQKAQHYENLAKQSQN